MAQEDLSSWINRKYRLGYQRELIMVHCGNEFDLQEAAKASWTQLACRNKRANCVSLPTAAYE